MLALTVLALSIGIADSVNPSTVGPALYLATGENALRAVGGFLLGAAAVNLIGGLVLIYGPGQAILAVLPHPGPRVVHVLELGLGAAAALLAVALWLARARVEARLSRTKNRPARSSVLLGAGIIAVELPTAFPYFAVIAAAVGSGRNLAEQTAVVLLFNAAFFAPLLGILALRGLAGARGAAVLEAWRARFDRIGAVLMPAFVLAVAIVLLAIGGLGLRAH